MTVTLKKPTPACIPVHLTDRAHLAAHTAGLPAAQRQWLDTLGFTGAPDTHALLPDDQGRLQAVWAGVRAADHPYALSALPKALPAGRYGLGDGGFSADALFLLLEDRDLAEAVALAHPRPMGDWRVRCIETGQIYASCNAAAKELHVSQACISLAIRQVRPVAALGLSFEALRNA
jgi:hypothetical protein